MMAAGVSMMQRLLAILLICILLPPLARAGKEPGVYLESRTECLAEQGIDQRLGAVLERHGAAGHLSLTVADAPAASGGLLVAGFGYRDNYHRWLLWLEGQACMLWEWNGVMLGPLVAVSPLWHEVEATGEVRSLPWLRVGLMLGLPFWTEKF